MTVSISRRQARQLADSTWTTGEVTLGLELDLGEGEDAEQVLIEEAARLKALVAAQFRREEQ